MRGREEKYAHAVSVGVYFCSILRGKGRGGGGGGGGGGGWVSYRIYFGRGG